MISSFENSRQNNVMDQPRQLVLASTSRYRRELLERLGLRFKSAGPDCDESALPGEAAPETALRLSVLKARSVARRFADALVIGSRSEEHTSELQSQSNLVCRLLLEKKITS